MVLAQEVLSCREIAALVNIHPSTVSKLANAAGHTFDTQQTAAATRVRIDRLRVKRADLLEETHATAAMGEMNRRIMPVLALSRSHLRAR